MGHDDSESESPAIERTVHLLEVLLEKTDGLTVLEMQNELNISRSTLFQMLRALRRLGYLEQSEKRGKYRPGVRLLAWRKGLKPVHQELITAFYSEMLRHNLTETVALAIPAENHNILILAQVESGHQVRSQFEIGRIYDSPGAAKEILFEDPSESTVLTGFSISISAESREIALPISSNGLAANAALIMTLPSGRWDEKVAQETWIPELRIAAARISYSTGAPYYFPHRRQTDEDSTASVQLSQKEIEDFIRGPWMARLACIRPDGSPHVIPVWYDWDGEKIQVVSWKGSQWPEYVLGNSKVSLTIDEPWLPFRRVVVRGSAIPLSTDTETHLIKKILNRLISRYSAAGYSEEMVDQVRFVFRIIPEYLGGRKGDPVNR